MRRIALVILLLTSFLYVAQGQVAIGGGLDQLDYSNPKEYEIGGVIVDGVKYLDHSVIIALSGLTVGQVIKIPGDKIGKAIDRLWKQGLFADVKIEATQVIGNKIFLVIRLQERPRLSSYAFRGIKKGEADEIRDVLSLTRGTQVTDNTLSKSKNAIRNFFINKGFNNVEIAVQQQPDTLMPNHVSLVFDIRKNGRVKIESIEFEGNTVIKSEKLRRAMKDTKRKRIYGMFKPSKYIETMYADDKKKVIDKYNEKGYRDARILSDTVYPVGENLLAIRMKIEEGRQFFFRDITWVGNSKFSVDRLNAALGIKKGDIFDQKILDERLFQAVDAVSSLYYDEGYLFFNINPVEVNVVGDSIDFEMRIYEGKQARINRVGISGNTKTNDHVIRREIRTNPGELFSRTNIIRSQRELAQLGYFDPERFDIKTLPNSYDGTVDLDYVVEERPSDQVELSGGWGANIVLLSVRLTLTNLSMRDFFKKGAWRPFPTGDGQRLSIAAQTNGTYYQAYSMTFIEPWLGGAKPNSLSVSLYHTIQSTGRFITDISQYMKVTGAAIGLGQRLEWPDDFFLLNQTLGFERYNLHDFATSYFLYSNGRSNNLSYNIVFSRNSVDAPIYPRSGSLMSLSLKITPPYSLFKPDSWWVEPDFATVDENGNALPQSEIQRLQNQKEANEIASRYKWIEYHKWKFKASSFTSIVGDLVLNSKLEFGYIGYYNKKVGPSKFEQFQLGGDGLMGYNLYGSELIGLRGYDNGPNNTGSLTPPDGGNVYQKLTFELRYPLSLNPNATFFALAFFEAGNAWTHVGDYSPFNMKRSAGVGVRVFMSMFGMLGVDWGYGFDPVPNNPSANGSHFAFTIGQNF